MQFEWDEKKAASNLAKHGVSFEEALTVFDDSHALHRLDDAHGEDRTTTIGHSAHSRLLFMVHVEVLADERVRIISARPATRWERKRYENQSP